MADWAYDPLAYEGRYRRVYEAGAELWENPTPTEALVKFASKLIDSKGSKAIDLGCGEGRDSFFLAEKGFDVTAVDTSRSALKRAKELFGSKTANMDFLVADVSALPLRRDCYDLAINIACLHMMTDQTVRDTHLLEMKRVLKGGGLCFSCNGGVDQLTSPEEFYRKLGEVPGTLTPRKIRVHGKEVTIRLPLIAAWLKSKEEYREEFEKAGFTVLEINKQDTRPVGDCWIITAGRESWDF